MKIKETRLRYEGKDITVYFSVDRCTHVAECLRGQPDVFDSSHRPWVKPDLADADQVAEVIIRCPTGALHFKRNDNGWEEPIPEDNKISICSNGAMWLKGDLEIRTAEDQLLFKDTRIALCRCGHSAHKPFCDGIHAVTSFRDKGKIASTKTPKPVSSLTKGPLRIVFQTNGPMILSGPFSIIASNGKTGFTGEKAILCRCGSSKHMPFCDGSHKKTNFKAE
jgi:CDGSH-type Zn-finger protein/uncharacterized Fe-S cluster protein YjdI